MSAIRPGDITEDTPVSVLRYFTTLDGPVASAARRELTRRGIGPDSADQPTLAELDVTTITDVGDYGAALQKTVSTASKTVQATAPAVVDAQAAQAQLTKAEQELALFTAANDQGKVLLVRLAQGRAQIHDARVQLTAAVQAQRDAVSAVNVAISAAQAAMSAAVNILQSMPEGPAKASALGAMGTATPAVAQLGQVEAVAQAAADAVAQAQGQLARIADGAQAAIEGAVYSAVTG